MKLVFHTYNKPNERLILLALCQRFECNFTYDRTYSTIICTNSETAYQIQKLYNKITRSAYRRISAMQTYEQFFNVPARTIQSEFMRAYASMACSIITGEPNEFVATTEVHRQGLIAGGTDLNDG